METKIFEVRDRMTYIPILCTKITSENEKEKYHLRRCGYGDDFPLILFTPLNNADLTTCDPYKFTDRTYRNATVYIEEHFDELETGDVVDVEYILGETDKPKTSEFYDRY
jgi:hypothetical protein